MRLSGQAVDLLCLLLERPGELIPREEIERRLWSDRNVDFNHSLDVVVSRLRTVLGDKGSSPRYIETVFRLSARRHHQPGRPDKKGLRFRFDERGVSARREFRPRSTRG